MFPELANNPGEGETTPDPELVNDNAALNADDNAEVENEDGDEPQPQDDDSEEIEHEGVKARVPKALKDAFLRHADYTRKTQEVAEQRRTLEERDTAIRQQAEMQQAFLQDVGTITALDRAIEQYKQTDWNTLRVQNPDAAQQRWFEYMQLKDARDNAASELSTKVNKRQQDVAAETAKRQNELRTSLARDIPGYTPEVATKMQAFGVSVYGFSADDISKTTDPRLHRVLHDAMIGRQLQEKAAKAAAAAKTAAAAEGVKPPAQVGRNAQATRVSASSPQSDKLSDAEWLRRRNAELSAAR